MRLVPSVANPGIHNQRHGHTHRRCRSVFHHVAHSFNKIFDLAFAGLGEPDRAGALMIGDSLTSDIAGGHGYGIDTCWYNRNRAPNPGNGAATHEITDLREIDAIVGIDA